MLPTIRTSSKKKKKDRKREVNLLDWGALINENLGQVLKETGEASIGISTYANVTADKSGRKHCRVLGRSRLPGTRDSDSHLQRKGCARGAKSANLKNQTLSQQSAEGKRVSEVYKDRSGFQTRNHAPVPGARQSRVIASPGSGKDRTRRGRCWRHSRRPTRAHRITGRDLPGDRGPGHPAR